MDVRLHARNQGFRWSSPPGPYRRVTPDQARRWSEDGYFLLEDALDHATVERVTAEIDPWEARVEAALREQGGRRFIARADEITFTIHLVLRSPYLRELCAGPLFQDLGRDLLGPAVRLYWDQAVYKKPGTEAPFPWHQDNGYAYVVPQQYVTCWVALTDATESNGCPLVVPGAALHDELALLVEAIGQTTLIHVVERQRHPWKGLEAYAGPHGIKLRIPLRKHLVVES